MLCCELCGEATECVQKEIDGKDLVLCDQCWRPSDDQPGTRQPVNTGAQDSEEDFEETII